jgi:hypothetical protein
MKETLEETALRLSKDAYKKHSVKDDKLSLDEQIQRSGGFIVGFKEGMINGAKWHQEDMIEKLEMHILINEDDWSRNPHTQLKDFINSLNKQD